MMRYLLALLLLNACGPAINVSPCSVEMVDAGDAGAPDTDSGPPASGTWGACNLRGPSGCSVAGDECWPWGPESLMTQRGICAPNCGSFQQNTDGTTFYGLDQDAGNHCIRIDGVCSYDPVQMGCLPYVPYPGQ